LKGGYQSASDGAKLSATGFGRITDDTSFIASINRLKSNDYRDGNGNTVEKSAADTQNEFFKLNTKITEAHRFSLSHDHHEDEGLRNRAANLLSAPFNPSERQRTERESTAFSYDYDPGQLLLKARLDVYVNDQSIDLAMDTPDQERNGVRGKGLNLSNISHLGQHKLTYGFDYRRVIGEAQRSAGALPNEKATVNGVYVQDDYAFVPSMLLTAGVRYDRYEYTDMVNQNFQSDGFSPSASLSWSATDNLTVRLSHARALRGVGIVEPYRRQLQTNDSDIAPEKGQNTELGMQWQNGPWHAHGAVFRQRIDNFIGYEASRRNLGDVRVNGYSASLGYQAGPWSSSIGVAYAKPTLNDTPLNDDVAMQLGNSTGRTWTTQLDYAVPWHHVKIGWTGRFVEDLTRVAAGARAKPGYAVHDVYAQLLPTGKDDFTVTLTVKNLFDRYYLEQASFGYHPAWGNVAGFPEPGRDVRLMLAWRI
jgi:hemoglobin/transferrin/lactoferrin receptor protein